MMFPGNYDWFLTNNASPYYKTRSFSLQNIRKSQEKLRKLRAPYERKTNLRFHRGSGFQTWNLYLQFEDLL